MRWWSCPPTHPLGGCLGAATEDNRCILRPLATDGAPEYGWLAIRSPAAAKQARAEDGAAGNCTRVQDQPGGVSTSVVRSLVSL